MAQIDAFAELVVDFHNEFHGAMELRMSSTRHSQLGVVEGRVALLKQPQADGM